LLAAGCHRAARPLPSPISLLVSGPVELEQLPRAVSLLEARLEQGEAVWLVGGPLLADTVIALVTDDYGPVFMLERAGAHAAVFGPELLENGVEAAQRLVQRSSLHLLCANIADTLGEPFGHPMLILEAGGARFGIAAIRVDSTDTRLRTRGVEFLPADRAAARVLGLLRMHSDVTGLVLDAESDDPSLAVGYDFTIGPGGRTLSVSVPERPDLVARVDLFLEAGRVTDRRVVVERLAEWPENPVVRRLVDSVQNEVDAVLSEFVVGAVVEASCEALSRMLVTGRLSRDIDGFLTDRLLFTAALGPGSIDARSVIAAMEEPGRFAIVELTGWQVKELTERPGVSIAWRTALRHMRLAMSRRYRIAMTAGFFDRHAQHISGDRELDEEPAWRIAVRLLARER